jgi:hypothetical protein
MATEILTEYCPECEKEFSVEFVLTCSGDKDTLPAFITKHI